MICHHQGELTPFLYLRTSTTRASICSRTAARRSNDGLGDAEALAAAVARPGPRPGKPAAEPQTRFRFTRSRPDSPDTPRLPRRLCRPRHDGRPTHTRVSPRPETKSRVGD